jgi:uncharacterized membrane protein (DUF373 family)
MTSLELYTLALGRRQEYILYVLSFLAFALFYCVVLLRQIHAWQRRYQSQGYHKAVSQESTEQ